VNFVHKSVVLSGKDRRIVDLLAQARAPHGGDPVQLACEFADLCDDLIIEVERLHEIIIHADCALNLNNDLNTARQILSNAKSIL